MATMTLAMITAANMIYLIPNSTLGVLAWMVAGTTVGFLQYGRKEEAASEASTDDTPREPPPSRSAYSRFPAGPARQTASYRRNLSR